jgi:hypothetical protein
MPSVSNFTRLSYRIKLKIEILIPNNFKWEVDTNPELQFNLLISYHIKIVVYKIDTHNGPDSLLNGICGSDVPHDRLIRIHLLTKNLKFIEIFHRTHC